MNRKSQAKHDADFTNSLFERRIRKLEKMIKKNKKHRRSRHRRISTASSDGSDSSNCMFNSDEGSERYVLQEQDVQTDRTPTEDNNEAGTSEKEEALDEGVLNIFGKRILADKVLAPPMHQEIAVRWEEIIKVGLPTDDRAAILKKYPPPSNCNLTNPPKLNTVVKAALQEAAIKRDERIVAKQEKIAACMAANGKALSTILTNDKENLALVEFLSDSSRLLADMHHDESLVRRSLILANINASVKETLNVSAIDEWLFGSDLDEKLKSRKAMEISCKDIRPIAKNQPPKGTKNFKTPPRQPRTKNLAVTSGGRKSADTARKTTRKPYYRSDRRKEPNYRRHR